MTKNLHEYLEEVQRYLVVNIRDGIGKNFEIVDVIDDFNTLEFSQIYLTELFEYYIKDELVAKEKYLLIKANPNSCVFTNFNHDSGRIAIFDLFKQEYI